MKNNWLKSFIKEAREVRLTAREKRAMLSRIIGASSIPSPYSFFLTIMDHRHKIAALAVMMAIVVTSGGTSFAASGALPGDVLYPIKVNINEEIQSFVAVTPNAKAKVGVMRTEKRLEEAKTLAAEGKLDDKTQAIIETNIDRHSESIKANIAAAPEVISEFTASIEEEEPVADASMNMKAMSFSVAATTTEDEVSSSGDAHLDAVIEKVNQVKREVDTIRKEIEQKDKEAEAEADVDTEASTEITPAEEPIVEEIVPATTTVPIIITTTTVTSTTTIDTSGSDIIE